jgi:flagellar basal-body rod protein FlgF
MEPILYKATQGGHVSFDSQTIMSHNLANINTPGFKADLLQAEKQQSGKPNAKHDPSKSHAINFTQGSLMTTGRDLDVAIKGEGWFAVQGQKGNEMYTRAGNFQINASGQLITATGQLVLGDGGPISIPPADGVEIASDGTVSIVPVGAAPNELAILDRIKMVDVDNASLSKNEEGLMQLKQGAKPKADSNISLVHGALEGSNVSAVDMMVRMISAGRDFEGHMKMMRTVDENGQKLAQLLQD